MTARMASMAMRKPYWSAQKATAGKVQSIWNGYMTTTYTVSMRSSSHNRDKVILIYLQEMHPVAPVTSSERFLG